MHKKSELICTEPLKVKLPGYNLIVNLIQLVMYCFSFVLIDSYFTHLCSVFVRPLIY